MFSWSTHLGLAALLVMVGLPPKANSEEITPTQAKRIFDSLTGSSGGWSELLVQAKTPQKEPERSQSRPVRTPFPPAANLAPPSPGQKPSEEARPLQEIRPQLVPRPKPESLPSTRPEFVPTLIQRGDDPLVREVIKGGEREFLPPGYPAHPPRATPPRGPNLAEIEREMDEKAQNRVRMEQLRQLSQEEPSNNLREKLIQEVRHLEESMSNHQKAIEEISGKLKELRKRFPDLPGNVQKGQPVPMTRPNTNSGTPPTVDLRSAMIANQMTRVQEQRQIEERINNARNEKGSQAQQRQGFAYMVPGTPLLEQQARIDAQQRQGFSYMVPGVSGEPPMLDMIRQMNERMERVNSQMRNLEEQIRDLRQANQSRQPNNRPRSFQGNPTGPNQGNRQPMGPNQGPQSFQENPPGPNQGNLQPMGPNHGPQSFQGNPTGPNQGYLQPMGPNHGPQSFQGNPPGPNYGPPQPMGPNHGPQSFQGNAPGPNQGNRQPMGPKHGPQSFQGNPTGPNQGNRQPMGPNHGPQSFQGNPAGPNQGNRQPMGPNHGPQSFQGNPHGPNHGPDTPPQVGPMGFIPVGYLPNDASAIYLQDLGPIPGILVGYVIPKPNTENTNGPKVLIPNSGIPLETNFPVTNPENPFGQRLFPIPPPGKFADFPSPVSLPEPKPAGINRPQTNTPATVPVPNLIVPKPAEPPRNQPPVGVESSTNRQP